MLEVQTRIQKVGKSSIYIRVPSEIAKALDWKDGDTVIMQINESRICVVRKNKAAREGNKRQH